MWKQWERFRHCICIARFISVDHSSSVTPAVTRQHISGQWIDEGKPDLLRTTLTRQTPSMC